MSDKRRLGKGLGALIPDAVSGSQGTDRVDLDKIKPNPFQPRKEFDENRLKELAESIREHGVLQAVVLSPDGDDYILVAGERRCRAARMAGLRTVPAIVKHYNENKLLEIALVENLQRENLNPVEEAKAYRQLMKDYGYTQEDLAKKIGKGRSSIANSIRLLSLPSNVLDALNNGTITPGQARPLLSIENIEKQKEAGRNIITNQLSAREAEKLAARIGNEGKAVSIKEQQAKEVDPLYEALQLDMQPKLGTKVRIKRSSPGGVIEIHYYSEDDLNMLVQKLLPEGLA